MVFSFEEENYCLLLCIFSNANIVLNWLYCDCLLLFVQLNFLHFVFQLCFLRKPYSVHLSIEEKRFGQIVQKHLLMCGLCLVNVKKCIEGVGSFLFSLAQTITVTHKRKPTSGIEKAELKVQSRKCHTNIQKAQYFKCATNETLSLHFLTCTTLRDERQKDREDETVVAVCVHVYSCTFT